MQLHASRAAAHALTQARKQEQQLLAAAEAASQALCVLRCELEEAAGKLAQAQADMDNGDMIEEEEGQTYDAAEAAVGISDNDVDGGAGAGHGGKSAAAVGANEGQMQQQAAVAACRWCSQDAAKALRAAQAEQASAGGQVHAAAVALRTLLAAHMGGGMEGNASVCVDRLAVMVQAEIECLQQQAAGAGLEQQAVQAAMGAVSLRLAVLARLCGRPYGMPCQANAQRQNSSSNDGTTAVASSGAADGENSAARGSSAVGAAAANGSGAGAALAAGSIPFKPMELHRCFSFKAGQHAHAHADVHTDAYSGAVRACEAGSHASRPDGLNSSMLIPPLHQYQKALAVIAGGSMHVTVCGNASEAAHILDQAKHGSAGAHGRTG